MGAVAKFDSLRAQSTPALVAARAYVLRTTFLRPSFPIGTGGLKHYTPATFGERRHVPTHVDYI